MCGSAVMQCAVQGTRYILGSFGAGWCHGLGMWGFWVSGVPVELGVLQKREYHS